MPILIALLIIIPALEVGVIIVSGSAIGIIPTIILMIATGFIGAGLSRNQGLKAFQEAQRQMAYGRLPGETILDGLCILLGGILLLFPGFLTDVLGLFLLIPITRKFFKKLIKKRLEKMLQNGQFYIFRR
ncbi:FxsA family protein [Calidifontibacillus erzurumensis]|uniref:FxsA family protein n=1 Tax=Calidifontibacillus erzurumensis TaxID=2741433 RepID=UPI001E3FC9A6|nr:FxsA family protein [Calidifontibacillus erzurumensis]